MHPPSGELAGKVALITGASRGIGRVIAQTLAREVANLVLVARSEPLLYQLSQQVQETQGCSALVCALDLRDPATPVAAVEAAINKFSRLDILINNAGATKRGEFLALTEHDWADGFALKFFGTVRLCRAAWPYLVASQGSIVNIAGIGGRTPGAEFAIGGSVNAALLSLTKALAEAGIRDGIQVNAVNPGSVQTDRLTNRIRTLARETGLDEAAASARLQAEARITRFGEPEDVAELVSFLVSRRGRWMQGSLIDLDGGQTKTI